MALTTNFLLKQIYDRELPNTYFNGNFIDFEAQYPYGILNENLDPIIARAEKMKPLAGNPEVHMVSFAANAYSDMMQEIQTKVAQGQWEAKSVIPQMKAHRGAQNSLDKYHEYIVGFFQEFANAKPNFAGFYKNKEITSFHAFVRFLEGTIVGNKRAFLTLNGFLLNGRNIFQSGLAVELFNFSKNKAGTLFRFVTDPGFKRYLMTAQKYGFLVNRNAPWMLIANLNSPAMHKYIAEDASVNLGAVGALDNYFHSARQLSFTFFLQYLISFYNTIVESEPQFEFLKHSQKPGCGGYERVIIKRLPVGGWQDEAMRGEANFAPGDVAAALQGAEQLQAAYGSDWKLLGGIAGHLVNVLERVGVTNSADLQSYKQELAVVAQTRLRLLLLYFSFRFKESGNVMGSYAQARSQFLKVLQINAFTSTGLKVDAVINGLERICAALTQNFKNPLYQDG